MTSEKSHYSKLKELAFELGFSSFGVAALPDLEELATDLSPETTRNLQTGISLAVRLSDAVLEDIEDHPTRLYLHHYRQANYFLDRNAFELAQKIGEMGGKALAIGASQNVDWVNQRGHIPHKEIARRAGLGWIGRNNLLVTPEWGARVRLVTILTDLPLPPDRPLERDCGDCRECVSVCPAGAIAEDPAAFDHRGCYERLTVFKNTLSLGHHICGVCVKACSPEKPV